MPIPDDYGATIGERTLNHLRTANDISARKQLRMGLRIISLIVATLYSLTAVAQIQFTEVGNQAGIAGDNYTSRTTHGLGPIWIDYDKDGWPDLFLVNGWNSNGAHLFHNEGDGTFSRQDALLPAMPVYMRLGPSRPRQRLNMSTVMYLSYVV